MGLRGYIRKHLGSADASDGAHASRRVFATGPTDQPFDSGLCRLWHGLRTC